MDLAIFFEKFDQFAEAPDAVAKLRELVLELAVRGCLSERRPKDQDEPAWRAFLGEFDSRIYESDPGPPPPFEIPEEWRWVCVDDAAEAGEQKKPDALFTYIDVGSIDNSRGVIKSELEVIEPASAPSRARKLVRPGAVIYATVRPYLKNIAVVDREFSPPAIVSTAFAILQPRDFAKARFLFYWLRSESFAAVVAGRMKGVAYPAINDGEFRGCPVPLPPFAEQKRIVAKVDELMALCDRLEAQQQERETRHAALARASLARFAAAPTPANLNFLFHSSFSIPPSDLRKSILTLAVQGKLVPQKPSDEPAESTFAGLKPLPVEGSDLPSQWARCTYRTLTTLITSGSRGWKEFYSTKGSIFVRTQNIKTDTLVLDDVAYVDLPKSAEGMRAQVLKNDILVTITGANVTKAARVEAQVPEAYVNTGEFSGNLKLFTELKQACQRGFIIPFVGAGMSKSAGCPEWKEYLLRLCRDARLPKKRMRKRLEVDGDYEGVMDEIVSKLTLRRFERDFERDFQIPDAITGAVNLLPEIFDSCVVTTNFDRVLERVYESASRPFVEKATGKGNTSAFFRAIPAGQRYLLKLHGNIDSATERILKKAEYDSAYGDSGGINTTYPVPQVLRRLFTSYSFLFIGCSLANDRTIRTLSHIAGEVGHENLPHHYAILACPTDLAQKQVIDQRLADAHISPLWFPEDEFQYVEEILQLLAAPY